MKRTMSSNSNSSIKNRIKIDYKNDDDNSEHPKIMSRVVSNSKDSIRKREQVIAMQSSRKNDIDRNKRMFGDLIGHIQKFKREENILKDKEDKKAQIEQKIEEQAALDKIKMKQEREALIANRRRKQMEIRSLELKVEKLNDLQMWEENQKRSLNYIKTSIKPALFWLPKVMDVKTTALQKKTSQDINDKIEERRKQVDEEIKNIENSLEKDDSMDENFDDKKHTSHNDVSYENGKQDETDRGKKFLCPNRTLIIHSDSLQDLRDDKATHQI